MVGFILISASMMLGVGWALLLSQRRIDVLPVQRTWVVVLVLLPLVLGGGVYLILGHADMRPRPFAQAQAERRAADPAQLDSDEQALLLEEIVRKHPEDAEGWRLLGHVYLNLNRAAEAMQAFGKALRLDPKNADAFAGYAGARIRLSDGAVDAAARAALAEALKHDPTHATALFLSVIAAVQGGNAKDVKAAIAALRPVLAADDPRWRMITALEQGAKGDAP